MAQYAKKLVEANGFKNIEVIHTTIEDLELPEKVDTMISEPLGIFLLNERMLETFVIARKKFLKPGGKMFPTRADLFLVPFTDQDIEDEQLYKCEFWKEKDHFGVDFSCLHPEAVRQKFQSPVCDTISVDKCLSAPVRREFNFETCSLEDLMLIDWHFEHTIKKTALLHGYMLYFDAYFEGTDNQFVLHTGPEHPPTHWYAIRLLLEEPIGVNRT